MKKTVAWLGGEYFSSELEKFNYDVRKIIFYSPKVYTWEMICSEIGCEPDVVVYADASIPPPIAGVESFPCPTVFYCIDSHIHSWYPLYAQGFDMCAVSLKDHICHFKKKRLKEKDLLWLPPYPIRNEHPPKESPAKELDVIFVGNVNDTTPFRRDFLNEFSKGLESFAVKKGSFAQLFPTAHIVLNIAERGDLNFRVFEALACGACLLTPKIENGQETLFTDGFHFFTYELNNSEDALRVASFLLENKEVCRKVGENGNRIINSKHRPTNRAMLLVNHIESFEKKRIHDRLANQKQIKSNYTRLIYLHWAAILTNDAIKERYLQAAL
tara:strand:- start:301 stop:1284 length:984 start_codon:yes stop_codon:yes gene_type:complete